MNVPLITPRQLDLLHAVLDEGPSAGAAWLRWERATNWTVNSVDGGSFRLLPLAYSNLKIHAPELASLARLKGIHRRAWCTNTLLFNQVKPALQRLHDAQIELLLFKGVALIQSGYSSAADRPMADVDVLVPSGQIERAFALLMEEGWELEWRGRLSSLLRFRHSLGLHHARGGAIDLHHRVLLDNMREDDDDDLWKAARPMPWLDIPFNAPALEDELIITCIHGWVWNPVPSIRWVADAMILLRKAGGGLDWSRVIEQAQRRKVSLRLSKAMGFIASEWPDSVPQIVLEQLKSCPKAPFEEAEEAHLVKPAIRVKEKLRSSSFGYQRLAGKPRGLDGYLGWMKYQLASRQAPSMTGLPRWLLRKIHLQMQGTVRHPR